MNETVSTIVEGALPSFADYGEDFQERVVQAILIDTSWAEQMVEIIKVEYFELEHFQFLVKTYYSYFDRYRTFPTVNILASIVKEKLESRTSVDEVLLARTVKLLKKVKSEPDLRDLPYVKEKALDFCKKQAMKEALYKAADLMLADDYGQVRDIISKALLAGEETGSGHDFEEDREARFNDTQRDAILTGIPELDHPDVLNGGLGRGELGIFVAAPSVGKSHWLVHLGASALSAGLNVLHFSLEMEEVKIGKRYDGWFTGVDNKKISQERAKVVDWYKENGHTLGRLIIKEFPSGSATANTLRSYIQKIAVKKNFRPDVIIVDYADEMAAIKKFDSSSSRHEFKAIYRDLRNLARELNVALWSASQSNKEGSSADIITGENMAESYRKLDVPDFVFTGACKPEDKAKGILNGFVAKNRNGNDGLRIPMKVDKSISRFQVIDVEEYAILSRGAEDVEREVKRNINKRLKKDQEDLRT